MDQAEFKAKYLNVKKKDKHTPKQVTAMAETDVCQGLTVLKSNRTVTKCRDDFESGAWVETFQESCSQYAPGGIAL